MALTGSDAVVVGAGVIGLTTAVCLAEAGLQVTVVAADPPERTASMAAGAMVGPIFVGRSDPGGTREHDTFDEFVRLAGVPGTGVRISTGRFAARVGGPEHRRSTSRPMWCPLGRPSCPHRSPRAFGPASRASTCRATCTI